MKRYNALFKDIIKRTSDELLNEVTFVDVEFVDGLKVTLHIQRLCQSDIEELNNKYATVICKDITSMTPREIALLNQYKYDLITKTCISPVFTEDDLRSLEYNVFTKIYNAVCDVLVTNWTK